MCPRVKICGLTREADVAAAAAAGADALGFVFYPPSPRALTPARAAELRRAVPPFVSTVALFVDPAPRDVEAVLAQAAPDLLQFHGDESPEACRRYGRPYLRAFRVGAPGLDTPQAVLAACRRYPDAIGWLFDSYSAGYGGSGRGFDPALLAEVRAAADARPLVLAGGLAPDNVAAAWRASRPYAVDVSSGVEDAPGQKSVAKIAAFMAALRSAAA